ncbi:unnamed protein product [Rhizophagus irregularis]|nr:unnamed protein product [Rhizophagus irregularis]CAB4392732.1 unnamed protein product [Rhizophagus irregularis]CAB5379123.1 unnamed protein product [Rhizophagus irregularis]
MSEILLNCLAVPNDLIGKIRVQDVVVVEINDRKSIHFLREEIRKKYSPLFDNIPFTKFDLYSIDYTGNVQELLTSLNGRHDVKSRLLDPMDKIFERFKKINEKDLHVIVYLDIQTPSPDS